MIPVAGQMFRIEQAQVRGVVARTDTLQVRAKDAGPRVQGYLKTLARERLTAASDAYSASLGKPYARLTLRDTRWRWGSCSSAGALNYSWRLIMAPPEVLDYVAAHEVAHLAEMNHSPAFWSVVTRLFGAYDAPRRWLQENGVGLHRYRFESAS